MWDCWFQKYIESMRSQPIVLSGLAYLHTNVPKTTRSFWVRTGIWSWCLRSLFCPTNSSILYLQWRPSREPWANNWLSKSVWDLYSGPEELRWADINTWKLQSNRVWDFAQRKLHIRPTSTCFWRGMRPAHQLLQASKRGTDPPPVNIWRFHEQKTRWVQTKILGMQGSFEAEAGQKEELCGYEKYCWHAPQNLQQRRAEKWKSERLGRRGKLPISDVCRCWLRRWRNSSDNIARWTILWSTGWAWPVR